MRRLIPVSAVLLVLAMHPAVSLQAENAAHSVNAGLAAAVTQRMLELGVPGAIVGVWAGQSAPWTTALGYADAAGRRQMQTDDVMRIGSITKSFTAIAVLQLQDRQVLSLDDPVSKYISGVPRGEEISLASSGI